MLPSPALWGYPANLSRVCQQAHQHSRKEPIVAPNIRFTNPKSISKPPGYTHVVEVTAPGRTVYIAGQLGLDLNGKLVGAGDFRAQATQAFENLKAAVAEVGEFEVDIDRRTARLAVADVIEGRGEPIRNPVTGAEHHARIELPLGFEYTVAEMGRGWSKSRAAIKMDLADSYGQFANIHLCQSGVVR
jgi:enamine deaminase RidA (YjgF/YER057c/UK114 family)